LLPSDISGFRIDQVNSRTDCAGYGLKRLVIVAGKIVGDKTLHVVSGHRTSVDEGSHYVSFIDVRA